MKIALIISANNEELILQKKELCKLNFITICDFYINSIEFNSFKSKNYDIIFYDMNLFQLNGKRLYKTYLKKKLRSKIVLLSNQEITNNFRIINKYGINGNILLDKNLAATGYIIIELLKQFLLNNIQSKPVTNNPNFILLTDREKQILKLFVNGFSYKEVGNQLDVKLDTVRSHIRNMYRKLNVRSKTEAVMKIIETGIVD
jgi:DNA-binding NarL/FixJ family response regulator